MRLERATKRRVLLPEWFCHAIIIAAISGACAAIMMF
jgi:hypothetical protein